jgi:hypothetical protein
MVIDGIDGNVGEFMKRLFCRPYGTNPDVCVFCVPAVNYWAIVSYPYGIGIEICKQDSPTVLFLSRRIAWDIPGCYTDVLCH